MSKKHVKEIRVRSHGDYVKGLLYVCHLYLKPVSTVDQHCSFWLNLKMIDRHLAVQATLFHLAY